MRKLRTIEMNRLTLEEFKEAEKLPLIVVLDDVVSYTYLTLTTIPLV